MGTSIHKIRGVLLGLALFAGPAALGADPIVVTTGLVETNVGISAARVTLEGEGFELRTAASFGSPLAPLCSPCAGGTPVTLNGSSRTRAGTNVDAAVGDRPGGRGRWKMARRRELSKQRITSVADVHVDPGLGHGANI